MRVKICGVTTVAAAEAAAAAGADFVGLNFHPPSPRFLTAERAAAIAAVLPAACAPVGVFVDAPPVAVAALAGRVGLRWVQLHGDEPPEAVRTLRRAGFAVIKAFRLAADSDADLAEVGRWLCEAAGRGDALPDALLVDAAAPGQHGGTGRLLADGPLVRFFEVLDLVGTLAGDAAAPPRVVLAGGLRPENVAARIAAAGRDRIWAVDTASGVESAPGVKDPARVAAFVRAARGG